MKPTKSLPYKWQWRGESLCPYMPYNVFISYINGRLWFMEHNVEQNISFPYGRTRSSLAYQSVIWPVTLIILTRDWKWRWRPSDVVVDESKSLPGIGEPHVLFVVAELQWGQVVQGELDLSCVKHLLGFWEGSASLVDIRAEIGENVNSWSIVGNSTLLTRQQQ